MILFLSKYEIVSHMLALRNIYVFRSMDYVVYLRIVVPERERVAVGGYMAGCDGGEVRSHCGERRVQLSPAIVCITISSLTIISLKDGLFFTREG